jgi:hypothetical protein
MIIMTCRDIIIEKLKDLKADGLINKESNCYCSISEIIECMNVCGSYQRDCIPGKTVDGKWQEVEEPNKISHGFIIIYPGDYCNITAAESKQIYPVKEKIPSYRVSRETKVCELIEVE